MEDVQFTMSVDNPQIPFPDPCGPSSAAFDWESKRSLNQETHAFHMEEDENEDSLAEMVCDSGSRLVPIGFTKPSCADEIVHFVNAGAISSVESDSGIIFLEDKFYEGGDTFQTEEFIAEGGYASFIYQSARLGNFCYRIENLQPGDYLLDLHFAEIINTHGPKGMRVFNVFMQDEKILSDLDIFSIVGSNKPLQLVGVRVSISEGVLILKFEGIIGSPIVSGICIRKGPKMSASKVKSQCFVCTNCSTKVEYPSAENKVLRTKLIAKYEKNIQELKDLLQKKTDECYQSWMSCTAANEQLEKVRMELDNKTFRTYSLDQELEKQGDKLKSISSKYDHDQKSWTVAIDNIEQKVKRMKRDHSQLSREAHECVDSIPDLTNMVSAVQSLVEQCEDLKLKYNEEQVKRRKLFNQVQEAKGNIRVFCRCRPLSKSEAGAGFASVADFDAARDGELGIISNGSTRKTFKFDRVFTPKDGQVDVFADAAPMVISVLDGYNVCIFAYGQTGTGKTFTMEGTEENRGVNYRTVEELFKISKERSDTHTYEISVSVLEVYNEQIRDLLSVETSKKLEIKQASEGFHHIPGIVEAKVDNIEQVWNVLQAGSSARAVGSNNVNEHSSRSHCMLCIMVRAKNLITGDCTRSKLWLVDLAGSERLAKTDVQGDRLKEAQNINRSLSALGDVISALANKSSHVPYRNSKLTHLLQDSLGGDSKTLMFVQISPSDQDVSETLSSLNFATRVRGVELGPARKQIDTSELQRTKQLLDKARQELRSKDEMVKKLEENLHSLECKAKGKDQFYKNQLDKIKELESQLDHKSLLHSQTEKQIKGKEEICSRLQQKVLDLENTLKNQDELQSSTYKKKISDLESQLKELRQESEYSSLILQRQVKELERKLKEHEENPEAPSLQLKVKELERKLKEREENQEAQSLQLKVKELERKLKEREENPEAQSLQLKVKELQERLQEQEKQLNSTVVTQYDIAKSTPVDRKQPIKEEATNEAEHHILKSSNSTYRRISQDQISIKEPNSQHEPRRKRLSRSDDIENKAVVPMPVSDNNKAGHSDPNSQHEPRRKRLSRSDDIENKGVFPTPVSNNNKARHSDPTKPPPPRVSRTSRPAINLQKQAVGRGKASRENCGAPGMMKERESKKRMWNR